MLTPLDHVLRIEPHLRQHPIPIIFRSIPRRTQHRTRVVTPGQTQHLIKLRRHKSLHRARVNLQQGSRQHELPQRNVRLLLRPIPQPTLLLTRLTKSRHHLPKTHQPLRRPPAHFHHPPNIRVNMLLRHHPMRCHHHQMGAVRHLPLIPCMRHQLLLQLSILNHQKLPRLHPKGRWCQHQRLLQRRPSLIRYRPLRIKNLARVTPIQSRQKIRRSHKIQVKTPAPDSRTRQSNHHPQYPESQPPTPACAPSPHAQPRAEYAPSTQPSPHAPPRQE